MRAGQLGPAAGSAWGRKHWYTAFVNATLAHGLRFRWRGPSPSLSIAAAVVWGAAMYTAIIDTLGGLSAPTERIALGVLGLLLAGALFLIDGLKESRVGARALLLGQAPAVLLAYWGMQRTIVLALFVVVAAQFPRVFTRRNSLLLVMATTLSLLVVNTYVANAAQMWDIFTNFVFQLFAALTVSYAVSARHAHETMRRVNAELLATRHLLHESARVEERLRLSRELHDLVGHTLTALKLQLRDLTRTVPAEFRESTAVCSHLADELLSEVRDVVSMLRKSEAVDLESALMTLVSSLPHPGIELRIAGSLHVSDIERATTILRCAQEGLTNALKYSDASHILVSLAQGADGLTLTVGDNGCGHDAPRWGNGLTGMRERLKSLGGTLEVVPQAHPGFRLSAWLPIPRPLG